MHSVALYGLAGHEGVILEAVAARKDAELVAVTCEDAAAFEGIRHSKALTERTTFYESWHEMMANERFDTLAVCSENHRHVEPILAAAARGINVMTEKPLALDADGLEKVRHAVTGGGIRFSVMFTMRTEGRYRAMREAVRDGRVGEPALIFAQKSYKLAERPEWMKARATYGGTIPYVGCHMLDLAMWVTGLDVERVSAAHGNTVNPQIREMEDAAALVFEMTGGAFMTMTLDFLRPLSAPTHGDDRLRVAGSHGVAEVRGSQGFGEIITPDGGVEAIEPLADGNLFSDFLDAVDGKGEHVISAGEAFRVTEILIAALAAADTGEPQEV